MFEINTDLVRREYHIYSDGAYDINRYLSEILDISNEVSSLSGMEDICSSLGHIASDLSRESGSLASVGEAIILITGRFDDTEDEIIENIESFRQTDLSSNAAIGHFDTEFLKDTNRNVDMAVMDELTALII